MFTPLVPQKFSDSLFSMKGISKKTVDEHLKLYTGYVNKYNEINQKLSLLTDADYAAANQVFSMMRELKTELSFAYGGVVNHELYFGHLGGSGGVPSGDLMRQINQDFGSFDTYKRDLKSSGLAARGWAWTTWNTKEKRLMNHIGDAQNTYLLWNTLPILALDTYEHAYFADYGTNRSGYIDSFFEHLNWDMVENSFKAASSIS